MHAYASAFGCRDLALIYPTQEHSATVDTKFRLPGAAGAAAEVHVLAVDVGDDALSVRMGGGPAALVQLFKG
jgi:hypothetical protein